MQPNYESDSKCQMTVAELSRGLQGTAVSQIQGELNAKHGVPAQIAWAM